MKRTVIIGFVLVLLVLLASGPSVASGVEREGISGESEQLSGGGRFKINPEELLSPLKLFHKMLSGRPGLILSGADPRASFSRDKALKSQDDVSLQAPGPGAAALVPFRDPSAKFSRNILISEDFSGFPYQTEPHLAVDPKDPEHLIVGMIDFNFPSLTTYVSIDGGAIWEGPFQVRFPRQDLASAGDPVVGFDREGNAFYGFISLDVEEFTIGPLIGSAVVSSISVARSEDAGFNWGDPIPSSRSQLSCQRTSPAGEPRIRGNCQFGFLDKPWMTLGPHPTDPGRDMIYVTYTNFVSTWEVFWIDELPFLGAPTLETVIELVYSEDGGLNWSAPIAVSPRVTYLPGGDVALGAGQRVLRIVQGSRPVVAPDGTLYVTWLDTTQDGPFEGLAEIYVSRSEDRGKTFTNPVRAAFFLETGFLTQTSFFRFWGTVFPRIAMGPGEEVYVVYTGVPHDNPDDDGDIFIVRSTDQGQNWSRAVRINDDGTGRVQFFPEIDVGPDGTLHAMWGDMRDDAFGTSYHIYYASSEDGGETWSPNSRVSDFPSNPNVGFPRGLFIGDYFGLKAVEDDVYMVWADTRLGEFGPPNQKIAFARQRLMPNPSIFISPPSGPGGKDVVVQGFNFQPNRPLFIQVDGVLVSTGRTQKEGGFNSQIFIPIAGEGPHEVRVIDASGNVASASFFMDFGFDNLRDLGDQIAGIAQALEGAGLEVPETITSSSRPRAPVTQPPQVVPQQSQVVTQQPQVAQQPEVLKPEGKEDNVTVWLFVGVAAGALPLILLAFVTGMFMRRTKSPEA